jgi:cytochrome c553
MKLTCSVLFGLVLGGAATIIDARDQPPIAPKVAEEKAVNLCSSCHGPRGISTSPEFPILAAQLEGYTIKQLEAFAKRMRADKDAHDFMWGIAIQLDEAMIGGIARYYAVQPPAPGRPERSALAMKGEEVFNGGVVDRGIPACAACHGQNAEGVGEFPRLAGQHAKYITKQVGYLQTQARATDVKHDFVKNLTPEETQAVAAYVQSR